MYTNSLPGFMYRVTEYFIAVDAEENILLFVKCRKEKGRACMGTGYEQFFLVL